MKTPFHKKLYSATQRQHIAVEQVFNFSTKLNAENVHLFLHTMYETRCHYKAILESLEERCGVATYHNNLLEALRKDLEGSDFHQPKEFNTSQINVNVNDWDSSKALGVFYVLAGSSAGAKVILSMIKKFSIDSPLNYFNAMSASSKDQMATFHELLAKLNFVDDNVIKAAQETFDFIQNTASNGLRQRDTKI